MNNIGNEQQFNDKIVLLLHFIIILSFSIIYNPQFVAVIVDVLCDEKELLNKTVFPEI